MSLCGRKGGPTEIDRRKPEADRQLTTGHPWQDRFSTWYGAAPYVRRRRSVMTGT